MSETKKPHLSVTQLEMLSRCGMQFFYRYVEGRKIPPGVSQIVGTSTHKAAEKNLTAKKDTGSLMAVEQVEQEAAEALKTEWLAQEPELSVDEKAAGKDKVKGEAIDKTVRLAKLHHVELAPKIIPVHLERPWKIELRGFSHDLIGYIDVQEPTAVSDLKTMSKTPPEDIADSSLQLTAYSLAVKAADGVAPEKVRIDALVDTKTPKVASRESTRDQVDHKRLLLRVERAVQVIDKGAFYPTSPDNWVCSERWCGYWKDVCPWGAKSKVMTGFEV